MTLFTRAQVLMSRVLDAILRRRRDSRLTEEITTHLELLTADYIARGLTPDDARAAARRAFGGVDQLKAVYRDQRGLPVVDALTQDLQFAWRLLGRDRGFSVTAVLVLGLGIGVNNMLFTILNAHTIRGLPLPNADRVAYISTFDDRNQDRGVSYPDYVDVRDSARSFVGLSAFTNAPATVSGDGRPAARFAATFVSANAFDLIGVRPVLGRGFAAEDDRSESPNVAMLGKSAWQSRYGGDPAVLGQAIVVDGAPATIVGVIPEGSGFPTSAEIWLPLRQAPGLAALKRDVRNLRVLGRVGEEVAMSAARAELETLFERLSRDHPDSNRNVRARMVPINEQFFGSLTDPAWMAFTAAGFLVVLISCANVANLMLAHSTGRAREFAIRTSLGATRKRILRQLLIEGVVLAAAGAVVGFGVSVGGVRLFRSAIPGDALPYWMDYSVDGRVLVALAAVSLFTVLLFALLPALHASKSDVNRVLKDGGRSGAGGRGTRRWTTAFLVAEFALAVVLLAQVVHSIRDAGPPLPSDRAISTRDVVTAAITLPAATYPTTQQRIDRYRELEQRVRAIPGVAAVSLASVLPLSGGAEARLDIAGRSTAGDEEVGSVRTVAIGPHYFRTLDVPLIRGREFGEEGGTPAGASAIINQRFAEKFFPDENPIGQQITLTSGEAASISGSLTIVGLAADVRQRPNTEPEPVVYLHYQVAPPATLALLVRTELGPATLVPLLRNTVMAMDAGLPLYRVLTLAEVARNAQWNRRLSHLLVLALTFIAVGLSTVGLYAVTTHGVLQRTQEIGLRMALGAQPRAVVILIAGRVLAQLALGFAAGIICTIAWQRTFGSPGSERQATDPQTLGATAAILAVTAVIACVVPARRATRLDPVAAIRGD
jgi:predicted permease